MTPATAQAGMTLENVASLCAILAFVGSTSLGLFWLLVKSRCVTKQRFNERLKETDEWKKAMETTASALGQKVAILESEHNSQLRELNATMREIKESLAPFIADHQNLRERVIRIETQRPIT